ncbi:hypothetical protein THSYN_06795 [Candidatus Thiodictyon syntrophicum]|jgi:hypothetical protein|uniref:Uncharacterized protein n=1 Tax=Candidatus Thiodictyon syntrophicum TaxID=1166950 RepID=A0A2K8U526_9GAMM|nr:hypothetical protein THSYN_06795 [Candidatus Thiodictyon syntrophicum]
MEPRSGPGRTGRRNCPPVLPPHETRARLVRSRQINLETETLMPRIETAPGLPLLPRRPALALIARRSLQ